MGPRSQAPRTQLPATREHLAQQWSLLLLLCMTMHTTASQPSASPQLHARDQPSLLPTCAKILGMLQEAQAAHLRDLIQLEGQGTRKCFYWQQLLVRIQNPPTDASEKIAFATNKTQAEVTHIHEACTGSRGMMTQKVSDFMVKLKGSVPGLDAFPDAVLRSCAMGRMNTRLYEYQPRVSLLLQYFKRPHIIQPYIERIQACKAHVAIELLVNADHPADHEAWAWAAYNTNGLVVPVFSNNVHEIRAYNRLAHLARGDILVFLADDDLPPTTNNCAWLLDLIKLFDRWHNTGVVGLRGYQHCHSEADNKGPWFQDPVTGLKAHWVQRVDMSPMAFRRSALMHVGGMDETLSEPGMCGIISDWEVCHRMWTAGWEVMAAPSLELEHDKTDKEGGTHKPATAYKCWGLQMGTAGSVMQTHGHVSWENEMCAAARQLNLQRLQLINATRCPYKAGCTLEAGQAGH